jgi:hypothetical protein
VDFYTTEDAVYRLDAFHEHCGQDLSEVLTRRMQNDQVMNAQVGVVISHRYPTAPDGSEIPDAVPFAEVARTFKA